MPSFRWVRGRKVKYELFYKLWIDKAKKLGWILCYDNITYLEYWKDEKCSRFIFVLGKMVKLGFSLTFRLYQDLKRATIKAGTGR